MQARVYFNLHRKLWSVQLRNERGGWYVAYHARAVRLENVRWKVSEAGRQRVIREQRKNVHAYACGDLVGMWDAQVTPRRDDGTVTVQRQLAFCPEPNVQTWDRVWYNPYKTDSFMIADEGLHQSPRAFLIKTERPEVYA
jgi:hypothetical protein